MELQNKGKGIAGHELVAGFDNIKILNRLVNAVQWISDINEWLWL